MFLSEALNQIRETIVKRCVSAGKSFWSVILKQTRDRDCFDGQYNNAVQEVIQSFVSRLNDDMAISLWRETEMGMANDSEDAELFPDTVHMDLEMELLGAVTKLAWEETQEEN